MSGKQNGANHQLDESSSEEETQRTEDEYDQDDDDEPNGKVYIG